MNVSTNTYNYHYFSAEIPREKSSGAEKNHVNYYPFGLKHKGYNNITNGGNSTAQKFKYNGVEFEEALGLNLYEMKYRHYDPAIGRWLLIDPRVENLYAITPYNAFLNDPVRYSDPDGDIPPQLIAGIIGALWEYGSQVYDNYQKNPSGSAFDNFIGDIDGADIITEGVATGLTMGANKLPGVGVGAKAATELVKSSIDVTINNGVKVVGNDKNIKDVILEAGQNTLTSVVAGKVADKTLGFAKGQTSKLLKNATKSKGNAFKNLNKANNIRANGNASQAARGSKSGTSNSRFKDVVKSDQRVQVAEVASATAKSGVTKGVVNKASNVATNSVWNKTKSVVKSWWSNVWSDL